MGLLCNRAYNVVTDGFGSAQPPVKKLNIEAPSSSAEACPGRYYDLKKIC